MTVTYLLVVVLLHIVGTHASYTFEDCERWAKEGECIKNPRFIWLHCLPSCVAHAKDDNAKCSRWRDEGECSKNKAYVPLHCPRSCDYSLAWHPNYRSAINVDDRSFQQPTPPDHTPSVAVEYIGHTSQGHKCPTLMANGVYRAAITMQNRITNILKYGHYVGYGRDSPSEFLQSYGVFEGILYTLRLYDIVLSTGRVASRAEKRIQEIINEMELSLKNYDGDQMTRRMRGYLYRLEEAGQLVTAYVEKEMYDIRNSYALNDKNIDCPELLHLTITDVHQLYTTPVVTVKNLNPSVQVKNTPPVFTLSNGEHMTSLGLGTWKLNGEVCEKTVYEAIKVGYRAIDTAQAYGNEAEVGKAVERAIADGIVTREEMFIATKLSFPEDAGELAVQALVERQLTLLRTDYIDLYYLHSPQKNDDVTRATWSGLEKQLKNGVIRSLGLSNHNSDQLRRHFKAVGRDAVPAVVLQNKFDVYHPGKQLDNRGDFILETCAEFHIQLVGYSPFSSFPFSMLPLDDPLVHEIASRRGKGDLATPAAVLTQWSLQQGVALIPRSTNIHNLATNYAAAVAVGTGLMQEGKLRGSAPSGSILSADEMALLSSLSNLVSSPFVKPNYFTEPSNY
mmetsp:Transcript_17905/g.33667  ORF Transcript_17905/g.33667 Transcript_17905/m.33667 type:complete len:620 (-) Transcript_17905:161-2020(-)